MQTSIGRSVHFLTAYIGNRHGHRYTCVNRDAQMTKYTLLYGVDHVRIKHSQWFRSALIRAVRLCSNYIDFNQEQTYLEITCLANGYSIDFVETHLTNFYLRFNAEIIRFCLDQTVYERLRRRLFDFIHIQRTLADKEVELEDKKYIFHFSYPYDYGSYKQFNKKFQRVWSTYLEYDSQLAHKNTKIILDTKHIYSLHTLLAREKPSNAFLQTTTKSMF